MTKRRICEVLQTGRVLVADGAWGTQLQNRGLSTGECPERWAVDRPADVKAIAQAYLAAGADLVETNSFGGTVFKLEHFGLADRVAEINQAAARLSAEAAAEGGGEKWVIASVGPTGKLLVMGDVTAEALYDAFRKQVVALAAGGADAICIETMSDIEEAALAVRAAREHTACEVIATFTFSKTMQGDYRTMMGVAPEQAVEAMLAAGADVIGANCGNGSERMIEIVRVMRAAAGHTPILVQANAGMPKSVEGVDVFPETPDEMAGRVRQLVDAGAAIIGGCCGTTPEHIRAIRRAVDALG